MSLLVVSEMSGLFVIILTDNHKHYLHNSKILRQPFQMQLSQKQRFWNKIWASELIYFLNHGLRKTWLEKCPVRKPRFRAPFASQHAKESRRLLKSPRQLFHQIISSLWEKETWKMSVLVVSQILGLFVNTLAADHRYTLRNSENWAKPIHKKLSKKQKTFSDYLAIFLNLTPNCKRRLKTLVEHRSTVNTLMGPKHYRNPQDSTSIIFFDQS